MKSRRALILFLCAAVPGISVYPQEPAGRVEFVQTQDLKRLAFRLHTSVDRIANARAALKEATDLALGAEEVAQNDYGTYGSLAGLWIQIDRKKAREMIGRMVLDMSRRAQSAEGLDDYRSCTSRAQQLLDSLYQVDPEHAMQIMDLWPPPPAKFGSAGEQTLAQFQSEFNNRIVSQGMYNMPDRAYELLQQPQRAAALPLSLRTQLAQALVNSNQREKAQTVLDQAIEDMSRRTPASGQNYDFENFLSSLGRIYPERLMEAFNSYQRISAGQSANTGPGVVMQMGGQPVFFSGAESTALNIVRGLYNRPELAMKLLDSVPGLRVKLDQLGGLDNVLSTGSGGLSSGPPLLSYSRGSSGVAGLVAVSPPRPPANSQADQPPNPAQIFQSLRGKAEDNPQMVRRKLQDAYRKKEHFSALLSLAQMANYQDPDLSPIALEVARGLLPQFDNLQERAGSLRNLISTTRSCMGEVDPGLLKEGMSLVRDMREEELSKEQANPPAPNVRMYHASDDLEIAVLAQSAQDDFAVALRAVRAMADDNLRLRALVQITQSLISNY